MARILKGQEPLSVTTIVLALALAIAAFGGSVLSQSLDAGVENNVRLQSLRIASVINIIQNAPPETKTLVDLPRSACAVVITKDFVEIKSISGSKEVDYKATIIQTPTKIIDTTFNCMKDKQIFILKTDQNTVEFQSA
ncbi:MAG: hypothetical protein HY832_01405 [Candidatus Aenigmarchaeota archaeon]|nr:hypothetical protein [Candidatus Aenigmarchaeota archaeon]